MRRQLTLFLTAVQFLTRLPTPAAADFEPAWLAQSARYFPLVGVLVGMLNVAVWRVANAWLPDTVAVGVMLAASLVITGAFHEDGLADACDGLGGGGSVERVLEIMKDSRIGAFGAIAIVMALGLKWSTLAALPPAALPVLVVGAHMMSRWCAIGLIWGLRYVRSDASAKSKPLADRLSGGDWALSGLIGALGWGALALLDAGYGGVLEPRAWCAAALAAALTALAAAAYVRRRLGGYTGDCLGAVQQLAELAFLIGGLAALMPARRVG